MKKHTQKAIDYFKRHKGKECFITSDGRVFHNKGTAESFAITLKDRTIEHFSKNDVEHLENESKANSIEVSEEKIEEIVEPILSEDTHQEVVEEPKQETAETTDDKEAELLSDLSSKSYNDLVSLVKHFGLTPKDKKATSLIEVLEEYKQKIQQ